MTLSNLGDAELVRRMREGDQAAWGSSSSATRATSTRLPLVPIGFVEHDAEDVFQEVFARAYSHLGSLRDDEKIKPWVGQLTRHLCIDRLRSGSREEPDADIELAARETIERIEEACAVQDALATLSPECREVVDRFFCRDESYRQIGDALGIPNGTIASRISRCLARLRERMEEG